MLESGVHSIESAWPQQQQHRRRKVCTGDATKRAGISCQESEGGNRSRTASSRTVCKTFLPDQHNSVSVPHREGHWEQPECRTACGTHARPVLDARCLGRNLKCRCSAIPQTQRQLDTRKMYPQSYTLACDAWAPHRSKSPRASQLLRVRLACTVRSMRVLLMPENAHSCLQYRRQKENFKHVKHLFRPMKLESKGQSQGTARTLSCRPLHRDTAASRWAVSSSSSSELIVYCCTQHLCEAEASF